MYTVKNIFFSTGPSEKFQEWADALGDVPTPDGRRVLVASTMKAERWRLYEKDPECGAGELNRGPWEKEEYESGIAVRRVTRAGARLNTPVCIGGPLGK